MIYYFDPSFNELDINPYSGLPYDNGWILLRLSDIAAPFGGARFFIENGK